MAAPTKLDRLTLSFVTRLKKLSCPYTEDIDDSFIVTMLMAPGEGRIRILHWLLCRIDTSVYDTLEPDVVTALPRIDSRIQRMLQVCASLGLCHEQDADLIQGITGGRSQLTFLDHLLDLATVTDEAEVCRPSHLIGADLFIDKMGVAKQFERDCVYVDTLSCQYSVPALFTPRINLLPPDITRHIEDKRRAQGHDVNVLPQPDTKALNKTLDDLTIEVVKRSAILKELRDNFIYEVTRTDDMASEKTRTSLRLALSQTCHLITTFTYTFENEIRPWCTHTPPTLTDLGPTVTRVYGLLQHLNNVLDTTRRIKCSFEQLSDLTVIQQAGSATAALESCGEFVNVLEESLKRQNSSVRAPMTASMSRVNDNGFDHKL